MMRDLHGLLPVTREEADRAGRERAQHDFATYALKTAARVSAHRAFEKRANEGDMGAILSGAIANRFGTPAALRDMVETDASRREPAVTDPQEMSLPQIPAGRGISANIQPGQLLEAGTTIDEFRRQEGLSKHGELEKDAWSPWAGLLKPIGQDIARAGRKVVGSLKKAPGQLATKEQSALLAPVKRDIFQAAPKPLLAPGVAPTNFRFPGTPPPIPAAAGRPAGRVAPRTAAPAAQAAPAAASKAPGQVVPPAGTPAAPGAAGGPPAASGKLSRKARKATEIEGVQQTRKPYKGPSLMGGLATAGVLGGAAYGLAKGVPAAARALEGATANPMAYGMGYSNLPYGYGQESTNF